MAREGEGLSLELVAPAPTVAKTRLGAAGRCLTLIVAGWVLAGAAAACPAPPPAVRDLDLPRFYSDGEGSIVDPKQAAAHKAAVEPLTHFLREVASNADKSWRRGKAEAQREAGACAVAWIAAWARGGAWLGRMATRQAEYQRKWDLAGTALAYLKVRRFAGDAERAQIEPWLIRLADVTRAFFDDPARKRNNHWYWQGLALAAVALATDSKPHWQVARDIMEDAARDIAPDGTLAHELERKSRALHYHAFAVTPLVVMAELAASRGEDWYSIGDGALHRLAKATLDGLAKPEIFARSAGIAQEVPARPGAGWTQLYAARFPDHLKAPLNEAPDGHRWLGGNVAVLAAALAQKP